MTANEVDTMSEEQNKKTVREFTQLFKNDHQLDGVRHLLDDGFVHHLSGRLPEGFEGLRQVGVMMNGAFPDFKMTEEDLIASGDKVVERISAVGTHRGNNLGIAASNKRVTWTETNIFRLKNGKIIEYWPQISMLELMQQVRAVPGKPN